MKNVAKPDCLLLALTLSWPLGNFYCFTNDNVWDVCDTLQVKFVHEIFRRLRPGVTVLALHGAMNQLKRVDTYNQFCRKQHAVLFATDIAARGLGKHTESLV